MPPPPFRPRRPPKLDSRPAASPIFFFPPRDSSIVIQHRGSAADRADPADMSLSSSCALRDQQHLSRSPPGAARSPPGTRGRRRGEDSPAMRLLLGGCVPGDFSMTPAGAPCRCRPCRPWSSLDGEAVVPSRGCYEFQGCPRAEGAAGDDRRACGNWRAAGS